MSIPTLATPWRRAAFALVLGCGASNDSTDSADSTGPASGQESGGIGEGSSAGPIAPESSSATDGANGSSSTAADTEGTSGGLATIGELIEHGTRDFDQSTLEPPRCSDVCSRLGGSCDDSAAGRSYYDCETGSHGGNFYACDYPEEPEYINGDGELCRLTEYACRCHDVLLERPYVHVTTAEDGLHACDTVCETWALACDWGGDTYDADGDLLQSLACADVPTDDAVSYDCHCLPSGS
jgi:hypothetical protein